MSTSDDVLVRTELLRHGSDPTSMRLRELLRERGVVVETALLAQSFPDDQCFEFGVVVTTDRRVFQFGFDYLHKPIDQGRFTEWQEMTAADVAGSVARAEVTAALELLDDASSTGTF